MLAFTLMLEGLLWLRVREGEAGISRDLLGSSCSAPGLAPRYHAVGDDGEMSSADFSREVGDGRRWGSDVR